MKTCLACGRSGGDAQLICTHCGSRLPDKPDTQPDSVAQIDFLLGQLDTWVAGNVIGDEQARRLRDDYLDRKARLENRSTITASHPLAGYGAKTSQEDSAPISAGFQRKQSGTAPTASAGARSTTGWDSSGDGANRGAGFGAIDSPALSYFYAVGLTLLLAGLTGLVAFGWNHSGAAGIVLLLIVLDIAFFASLRLPAISNQPVTRGAVTTAALLLVPLAIVSASRLPAHPMHAAPLGITASLACLAIAAIASRFNSSRAVTLVIAASVAASYYFSSSLALARVLHLHRDSLDRAHAPAYMLLALMYMATVLVSERMPSLSSRKGAESSEQGGSWGGGESAKRGGAPIWLGFGYTATVASLLTALLTTQSWHLLGPAALALALGGVAYFVAATGCRSRNLSSVAFVFSLAALALGLRWVGVSVSGGWWGYALATNVVGFIMLGVSKLIGRTSSRTDATYEPPSVGPTGAPTIGGPFVYESPVAHQFLRFSQLAAALGLVPQVCVIVVLAFALPALKLAPGHVIGALVCAAATLILLAPIARPVLVTGWIAYMGILTGFLASALAPHATFLHRQPHVGLGIALAASVLLWIRKQRDEARWCFAAALVVSAIYALAGGFVDSTLLALAWICAVVVIDAAIVTQKRRGGFAPADAIIGAVSLSLLVLLFDEKALPTLLKHWRWEMNTSLGLALPAILFAALSVSFKRERRGVALAMRNAALMLLGLIVLMQLHYAVHDSLLHSPMIVVVGAAFVCGLIALFGRSDISALTAISLTVASAVVFVVGPHPFYSPRETLLAWSIFVQSGIFAIMAWRDRKVSWTYAAALLALSAMLVAVHRITACPLGGYVVIVAVFDLAAVMAALALRERDEEEVWSGPLVNVAIITAYIAVTPLLAAFNGRPGHAAYRIDVIGFLLMAGVFALFAGLLKRQTYVVVAAIVLSAFAVLLVHHVDPLAQLTKLSVDVSYAALVLLAGGWLGSDTGTSRPTRYLPLGLLHASVSVGIVSVILAAFGLGDGPGRYALYCALLTGVVLLGAGAALAHEPLKLAGRFAFGMAMFLYAIVRIQHPGVPVSDYYLIGVGIASVVVAAASAQSHGRNIAAISTAGAMLVLAPLLAMDWAPHPSVWLAPIVCLISVAIVYWGLAAQTWSLTSVGTAGLAALIALAASGHTPRVHWAIFATLLGLVVIGAAVMLERRRTVASE